MPAREVVAGPFLTLDAPPDDAGKRALLRRRNPPERLRAPFPAALSGGERQRVDIARGLVHPYPVPFLDEPTASPDPASRDVVLAPIRGALGRRAAVVGMFRDARAHAAVVEREVAVSTFAA